LCQTPDPNTILHNKIKIHFFIWLYLCSWHVTRSALSILLVLSISLFSNVY
jgi:hypothetical protein